MGWRKRLRIRVGEVVVIADSFAWLSKRDSMRMPIPTPVGRLYSNGSVECKGAGSPALRPPSPRAPQSEGPDSGSARGSRRPVGQLHQRPGAGIEGTESDDSCSALGSAGYRYAGVARGLYAGSGEEAEGAAAPDVTVQGGDFSSRSLHYRRREKRGRCDVSRADTMGNPRRPYRRRRLTFHEAERDRARIGEAGRFV